MTIPDEAVEAAAMALAGADYKPSDGSDAWESAPDLHDEWRDIARAALTAAEPYWRAKVAGEIRAEIGHVDDVELSMNYYTNTVRQTLERAARLVAEGAEA